MSGGKRKRQRSKSKDGLFDDLESLSDLEIEESVKSLKASMQATEQEIQQMQQEREAEIALVQSLRAIQQSPRGIERPSSMNFEPFGTRRQKFEMNGMQSMRMCHHHLKSLSRD